MVLDANIWVKELLLNSPMGAALLYTLAKIGGHIGLPEITEKEVISIIAIRGSEAVQSIDKKLNIVRSLIGKTEEMELPSEADFEEAARSRFLELDDILVRLETGLDHYRSAVQRVIAKTPPNTTKEQFRDSLLWEAVIRLLPTHNVVLVTQDSDFYESKKFDKGLARGLIEECKQLDSVVTLHDNLTSYLRSVRDELPPLDYEKIASMIGEIVVMDSLAEFANSKEFSLGELKEYSIEPFITERRERLALEFKIFWRAFNVKQTQSITETSGGRTLIELEEPILHSEATLLVSGSCFFDERNNAVSELHLADIDCLTLSGDPIIGHGIGFMSGTITIGRKQIPHIVKQPINSI